MRRGPIAPVLPVCLELKMSSADDAVLLRLSMGATSERGSGSSSVYASYLAEKGLVGKEQVAKEQLFRAAKSPLGVC